MLTAEDNTILTRVGPGTPMGELMRRFWIPAVLSSEVIVDGAPARVRLLGEDLVCFRDSEGNIGLLEEACPHRRASLALAVNGECGLRCLYHGWKFGVNGQCLDIPVEPEDSNLRSRIRAKAYSTHEAGGVIWAYMGPDSEKPPLPDFNWFGMKEGHCVPFKIMEDCNYAQAVEGTIDSAHAGVLHRESPWGAPAKYAHEKDLRPKLEVEYTKYGLRYAAVRQFSEEQSHIRLTQVALPFFTIIPPHGFGPNKDRRLTNAFVPRDDVSTWHVQWFFDETQTIDIDYRIEEGGLWMDEHFRKTRNIDNWYMQDRDKMRTENMSGIDGIVVQDHAVSETQGRILDRTKEHLGTSDVAVVAWRRQMVRAAKAFAESGVIPDCLGELPWREVQSETVVVPNTTSWKEKLPLSPELALTAAK